jgi:hypothetical protein
VGGLLSYEEKKKKNHTASKGVKDRAFLGRMNVAKRDVVTLGLYALLGSLAGAMWGGVSLYSSRRVGSALRVHTLVLPRDTGMYSLAAEMERMRPDPGIFLSCVDLTDTLLYMHYELADGVKKPGPGQEQKANVLIAQIRAKLVQLRECFEADKSNLEADVKQFHRLTESFSECASAHVVAITRRTVQFRE